MKRGYAQLEVGRPAAAGAEPKSFSRPTAPSEAADWGGALAVFEALSRRGRLAVLRMIVRAGDAGTDAAAIGRELGMTGSALTLHLRGLGEAGLIIARPGAALRFVADLERLSAAVRLIESERAAQ